jgi:hypothetical protein
MSGGAENQNIILAGDALRAYERLLLAEAERVENAKGTAANLYRGILSKRIGWAQNELTLFRQTELYRGMTND